MRNLSKDIQRRLYNIVLAINAAFEYDTKNPNNYKEFSVSPLLVAKERENIRWVLADIEEHERSPLAITKEYRPGSLATWRDQKVVVLTGHANGQFEIYMLEAQQFTTCWPHELVPDNTALIDILVTERKRAVDLCHGAYQKHLDSYRAKKLGGDEMAFIQERIAEELRFTGNSISGKTALNVNEPLEDVIKREYKL